MTSHQPNSNQQNQSVVSTPTGEYMPQPFQNIEHGMNQNVKRHGEHFNIRFSFNRNGANSTLANGPNSESAATVIATNQCTDLFGSCKTPKSSKSR